ncbi:MAG: DUF6079 family protein [Dehalococcoidia bacterium]
MSQGSLQFLTPSKGPQPVAVVHQGIQYQGEVVTAERWDPQWGELGAQDSYFRIVLLTQRQRVPPGQLRDARIVVCIPGRALLKRREGLMRELRAIREAGATYLTERDRDMALLRASLEQQAQELSTRFLQEEGHRYASGLVQTQIGRSLNARAIFSGPSPQAWVERLATTLLEWAYPGVPIRPRLLPRPVSPEDPARLFQALFAPQPEPAKKALLKELGPGLGLSKPEVPQEPHLEDCPVFPLLVSELEKGGVAVPAPELLRLLAHSHGLTYPLALLYLLAFIYHATPPVEIQLAPGHGLKLSNGQPLRGDRLTSELIPTLAWESALPQKAVSLTYPQEVSWNSALPYTSLLAPDLWEVSPDEESSAQEARLREAQGELRQEVEQALAFLESFAGSPSTGLQETSSALNRLARLTLISDFRELYGQARSLYGDPTDLSQDLGRLRRLQRLSPLTPRVQEVKAYLEEVAIVRGHEELALDQRTLQERTSFDSLEAGPQSGPALEAAFQQFQQRYSHAYAAYHESHHQETARAAVQLERSALALQALARLNSITELGPPVRPELAERHHALEQALKRCPLAPQELPLTTSPRCPQCNLALGEPSIRGELEPFLEELDQALAEQNQRLSLHLVDRVLTDRMDEEFARFVQIVQVSDLSGLVNVLDDRLVTLIRRLLQG